jgi:hypothetical protein
MEGEGFIIDREDYNRVNKYKWHKDKRGYVYHGLRIEGKSKNIALHHFLIGQTLKPYEIDHINHNKSDNRKNNLRIVTHKVNQRNRSLSKNNKSGMSGVYWDKSKNKWRVNDFSDRFVKLVTSKRQAFNIRKDICQRDL